MMSLENNPLDFCLLIPCYNNFEGLVLSLSSVFYRPDRFVVVLIDDGSEIPISEEAIKSNIEANYSIVVLRNLTNKGITYSLNKGLEWIKENVTVKYIARLDCNDLCTKDRFHKQVEYLDQHPEVGLVGSWCVFENKKMSLKYYFKGPLNHDAILRTMHFRNIFIHPTVMFRKSLPESVGNYPVDFIYAEDYAFFWKLIKIDRSAIIDEFLVSSEINKEGISYKNRRRQLLSRIKVISNYGTNPLFKMFGIARVLMLLMIPNRLLLNIKNLLHRSVAKT